MNDPENWMLNVYVCDDCNIGWEDEWDCACDDECPQCGKPYTPIYSIDLIGWYSTSNGGGNA